MASLESFTEFRKSERWRLTVPTDYRRIVDYGRFLRSFANEPVTTLVRQEDLAYCASRLLLLGQYVRREDKALAELLDGALRDLAGLNAEAAIRRVRQGRTVWESSPVYWALCCHVLAQTLAEFSRDTSASTVTELRSSLADWFPRFRHSIESKTGGNEERILVCLQCFITQSAIFHDSQAMNWAVDRLMTMLTPERMHSEVALESAALLAGILSRGENLSSRSQLAFLFDRAAEQSPGAKEARDQISDIVPSHADHVIPSATHAAIPKMETGRAASLKKPKGTSGRRGGMFGRTGEALAPFIGPVILIVLIVGCVWGMGGLFDWFENNSNVGDQSLGDWYRNAESKKSAEETEAENKELMMQVAPGILAAAELPEEDRPVLNVTPAPTATPEATPAPADLAAALQARLEKDVKNLKSRIGVPRQILVQGRTRVAVPVYGEFTGIHKTVISPEPNQNMAIVSFAVNWFQNGQLAGAQSIDAHYTWDGQQWNLTTAARNTSPPDTPDGQKAYVRDPAERKWAADLFQANPFY